MPSGKFDLVTGYRFQKKDSLPRVVADRGLNLLMRTFFNLSFKDSNCAQKLYRSELLKKINIESRGYPAPTEILVKARELGAKIGEVGVKHYEREKGGSALKLYKTSLNFLKFLVYLRLKLVFYRQKLIAEL